MNRAKAKRMQAIRNLRNGALCGVIASTPFIIEIIKSVATGC